MVRATTTPHEFVLAGRYRRPKDVVVQAVVIPELKFRDIEREILGADLVEGADHAALHQRPEPFDGVRVDGTHDVVADMVTDVAVRILGSQPPITGVFISGEKADAGGDGLAHEALKGLCAGIGDHASDDVAFPLRCTDHDVLARTLAARAFALLVPVAIGVLAADVGLIDFDDPDELAELLVSQSAPHTVTHVVGGPVGTEAHDPLHLKGADALLAGEHHVNDAKPVPQGLVRVLEDGPDQNGEPIAGAGSAVIALPLERHRGHGEHTHRAAAGAVNAIGPTVRHQVGGARILVRKHPLELRDRHLVNAGHRKNSPLNGEIMA